MDRLKNYILNTIAGYFFSIAGPLFIVGTIILIIQLAIITVYIKIDFSELLQLYVMMLPELIFYITPIAYFVAMVLGLGKLSKDNETIAMICLGYSPRFFLRLLVMPALILSATLFFTTLFLIPHVSQIKTHFIEEKKSKVAFNISAGKLGQQFGDWMLFATKKGNFESNKSFDSIILFSTKENDEKFISAQSANIENKNGVISLVLKNGNSYTFEEGVLNEINFERLRLNSIIDSAYAAYENSFVFWTKRYNSQHYRTTLTINILLCFFPVMSLVLVLAFGINNVHYDRDSIYVNIFVALLLVFALSYVGGLFFGLPSLVVLVPLIWWLFFMLYKKRILKRY